jgi:hypothetical protein
MDMENILERNIHIVFGWTFGFLASIFLPFGINFVGLYFISNFYRLCRHVIACSSPIIGLAELTKSVALIFLKDYFTVPNLRLLYES